MIRPVAVVGDTTDVFVSALDAHQPAVNDELVIRYDGDKTNMLDLMGIIGGKESVDQTSYSHFEKDHSIETIGANAHVSGAAGAAIVLTLDSTDHATSGTQSYPQVGDIGETKDGVSFEITAVNKTVANAHTITLTPQIAAESLDIAADEIVMLFTNAWAEQTAQPKSIAPRLIKYTNNTQIIKGKFTVSGTELTNKTYFKAKDSKGREMQCYSYVGDRDEYFRTRAKMEIACIIGKKADNGTTRTTEGLWTFIDNNDGIVHQTGGAGLFNLAQLQSIIRKLDKNQGSKENFVYNGINLSQDWTSFLMNMTPNGGVVYGAFNGNKEIAINFGFNSVGIDNYTFHLKTYDLFNHAKLLGAPGYDYPSSAIIIPSEKVMNATAGKMTNPVVIRYKAMGKYSRDMEMFITGSADTPVATSEVDEKNINYRCEIGFEGFAGKNFVKIIS